MVWAKGEVRERENAGERKHVQSWALAFYLCTCITDKYDHALPHMHARSHAKRKKMIFTRRDTLLFGFSLQTCGSVNNRTLRILKERKTLNAAAFC